MNNPTATRSAHVRPDPPEDVPRSSPAAAEATLSSARSGTARGESIRAMTRVGMSEATRLFGLTARALRHYEDRGLVTAGRDRSNCRWYGPEARERLEWIARLRRAGVPISDIQMVLDAHHAEGGESRLALLLLEKRRALIETQLAQIDQAAREVREADAGSRARQFLRFRSYDARAEDDPQSGAHRSGPSPEGRSHASVAGDEA